MITNYIVSGYRVLLGKVVFCFLFFGLGKAVLKVEHTIFFYVK